MIQFFNKQLYHKLFNKLSPHLITIFRNISSQNISQHLITTSLSPNYETKLQQTLQQTFQQTFQQTMIQFYITTSSQNFITKYFATNYETNYETLYHKTFATKLSQHLITNISSQSFIINLHQTFNELFLRNDIVSCIMYHNAL